LGVGGGGNSVEQLRGTCTENDHTRTDSSSFSSLWVFSLELNLLTLGR
jgi:hypothetical protein